MANRFLFWVPIATHWLTVAFPAGLILALCFWWGPIPTLVHVLGALAYLYAKVLYPGSFSKTLGKPFLEKSEHQYHTKKRIAVVGAGPAGLAATKELLSAGHEVVCYDAGSSLGGTFAANFYPGGHLTSSPPVTSFSDFEPQDNPDGSPCWYHMTPAEYVQYLQRYADAHGVTEHLRLETKVQHIFEDPNDSSKVFIRLSGKCPKNHDPTQNIDDTKGKSDTNAIARVEGPFDHVAVCSGANQHEFIPNIPGLESFKGKILHTKELADPTGNTSIDEGFKVVSQKRVVAVGMGESMSDVLGIITRKMLAPTSYCAISVRKGAFIIPRINPLTGANNDFDSNRLRYALPKTIHNVTMMLCATLANVFAYRECANRQIRFDLMRKIPHWGPAHVTTTKSDDFVASIELGCLVLKPGICKIHGNNIHYTDGTVDENVDVLIFGTGYIPSQFPFLNHESFPSMMTTGKQTSQPHTAGKTTTESEAQALDFSPINLVFRMFHPKLGDKIAFIGLGVRALIGSIPTSAEMQARLFAMVVSGDRHLPSPQRMARKVQVDAKAAKQDMAFHNEKWQGLVNWIPFMDSLALEIGCLPKRSWFWTRPLLASKLLMGPMCNYHYRLHGPGAKPKMAEQAIRRLPYGSRRRDLAFFFAIHVSIALFIWPSAALNLIFELTQMMVKI